MAIIIYVHSQLFAIPDFNKFFFPEGEGLFNIYSLGLQGYAVFGLIFISGAVLEYNYRGLEKAGGYLTFLYKRFIRLYPAFWISLVAMLVAFPALVGRGVPYLLFEFTGFFIVLGMGSGILNQMGWFIGAILLLYMLYPWFSKILRTHGFKALAGFWIMSWGLRYYLITYNPIPLPGFYRWFPLCNAFEFCLGIYLIQQGLYPKNETTSPVIRNLSDVSFYAFLFHVVVITVIIEYAPKPSTLSGLMILYFVMMAAVLAVAEAVMILDRKIHRYLPAG